MFEPLWLSFSWSFSSYTYTKNQQMSSPLLKTTVVYTPENMTLEKTPFSIGHASSSGFSSPAMLMNSGSIYTYIYHKNQPIHVGNYRVIPIGSVRGSFQGSPSVRSPLPGGAATQRGHASGPWAHLTNIATFFRRKKRQMETFSPKSYIPSGKLTCRHRKSVFSW